MYYVVLCFTAALLCSGCRAASVNKHHKLLPDLDHSIKANSLAKQAGVRRFLALKKPETSYAHTPGALLTITCEAVGSPAPSIRWFKNNTPVYEHDSESTEVIDVNPSSLGRISATLLVTRAGSMDQYTCLASSGQKSATANTYVYSTGQASPLTERIKLYPLKPHILVSYQAFVDSIGNTVVLPCKARGHPKPRITWIDNNGTSIRGDERMKVLRSGELVISSLRWSDMGEFVCHATNSFGSHKASTFVYPALAG